MSTLSLDLQMRPEGGPQLYKDTLSSLDSKAGDI